MWIDVTKTIPDDDANVICVNENIHMAPIKAYFDGETKLFLSLEAFCIHPISVTHWSYMPEKVTKKIIT